MKKFRFCFAGDHNYLDCYLEDRVAYDLRGNVSSGECICGFFDKRKEDFVLINLLNVAYVYEIND